MFIKMAMEFVGITGTLIICLSVIPQLIKTYRTKSAKDLSVTYLITLTAGLFLLVIYSLYIGNRVFIFGNVLSLFSVVVLIGLRKRYRSNNLIKIKNRALLKGKEAKICHKPQLSHR